MYVQGTMGISTIFSREGCMLSLLMYWSVKMIEQKKNNLRKINFMPNSAPLAGFCMAKWTGWFKGHAASDKAIHFGSMPVASRAVKRAYVALRAILLRLPLAQQNYNAWYSNILNQWPEIALSAVLGHSQHSRSLNLSWGRGTELVSVLREHSVPNLHGCYMGSCQFAVFGIEELEFVIANKIDLPPCTQA